MSTHEKKTAARGYLLQLAEEAQKAHDNGTSMEISIADDKLNVVLDMLQLLDVDIAELLRGNL